ncbi:SprB repeat-containing protein, partial [Flavobacterium sp. 9AF]|uniref:SprB repeat-containing protein n=1 Tax=Flavobacterium sp. 9AF TaxID=2653142 RepID=UPI001916A8A4
MKQKITLLLFIISFLSLKGNAQTQFWSDTFEDTGAPSSGVRTPENDSGFGIIPYTSYFKRTDGSDIDLTTVTDGPYGGKQGLKFWAGEDHDAAFGTGNEEQQIDFTGINISGKTGLSFKGLFAAANSGTQWENEAVGAFSHTDYIILEYSIDGGAYVRLIAFFGDGVATKQLREDTNGDGIGDGLLLSKTFTEFNKTIVATGSLINLRLRVFSNNTNNEEWAIDNFRLFEAPVCTNPTVPTITASTNPVCNGGSTTLNISGSLNDATQWAIYSGSCGGTLLGTTATSSFVVTPVGPSTAYFVRGEGGCVTPGTCGTITVNASTVSLTPSSQTNVACNGGSNGAASVNVATGGVGPYTYNWTPGNPTGDGTTSVTGLTAGTWTCTVTDANSCTTSVNFTITQPTALSLTPASQTNIACNGGSNGAAAVNVATGGAGG